MPIYLYLFFIYFFMIYFQRDKSNWSKTDPNISALEQVKSPYKLLSPYFCELFLAGYETLPFSSWHFFVPQMQLSFPICLFLFSQSVPLTLISCFELHQAFSPPHPPSHHYLLPISMSAYLLFTAPGGYLSFSPLHCDHHGDTQIPRSSRSWPPPAPP